MYERIYPRMSIDIQLYLQGTMPKPSWMMGVMAMVMVMCVGEGDATACYVNSEVSGMRVDLSFLLSTILFPRWREHEGW